ncbi:MAG: DUF3887 domain-containing protein [Lachnospiraceae bacterium]|nr:DUF3887 domain-containing protein [Lachnospiraceae bacterium]
MTAETYVNDIISRIKCSGKRRREIKQQLLSEINAHAEEGMELDEILKQIGTATDVADDFNENMSEAEKKKYSFTRTMMLVIPICLFLFILIGGVIYVIPRQKDISESKYFDAQTIGSRLSEDIAYLNEGDYEALRNGATEAMTNVLKDGLMESIQKQTGGDWGAFVSLGDPQIVEVNQSGMHYAVAEINANYEKINVTYRITYDNNMKLAGLYVR